MRDKLVAYIVISIVYFLTIIARQGTVLYRQFALGQDFHDFEDIAIIMTINSLFLISAQLYFGAIPIRKLKAKRIILFYLVFVILGSVFTYAKYNVFQSPGLTFQELFGKLLTIITIIGIIMGFWILLSILGKKKIDQELE